MGSYWCEGCAEMHYKDSTLRMAYKRVGRKWRQMQMCLTAAREAFKGGARVDFKPSDKIYASG